MKDQFYRPSGDLQGDTKAMPDRGTGSGMAPHSTDTGGRSLDRDATNRIGGANTAPTPAAKNMPCK